MPRIICFSMKLSPPISLIILSFGYSCLTWRMRICSASNSLLLQRSVSANGVCVYQCMHVRVRLENGCSSLCLQRSANTNGVGVCVFVNGVTGSVSSSRDPRVSTACLCLCVCVCVLMEQLASTVLDALLTFLTSNFHIIVEIF
jgi:hypothetical protein